MNVRVYAWGGANVKKGGGSKDGLGEESGRGDKMNGCMCMGRGECKAV